MTDALLAALRRRSPAHGDVLERLLPLLEAGESTPFLARYRRDALCGLDPSAYEKLREVHRDERDLERRRQAVLRALEQDGEAAEPLRRQVRTSTDRAFLEDVIRPLRKRRRARLHATTSGERAAASAEPDDTSDDDEPTEASAAATPEQAAPEASAETVVSVEAAVSVEEPAAAEAPVGVTAEAPVEASTEVATEVSAEVSAEAASATATEAATGPAPKIAAQSRDPMGDLADLILAGAETRPIEELLAPFCGPDGAPPTPADQRKRLLRLLADRIASDPLRRAAVRTDARRHGLVITTQAKGKDPKDLFAPVKGLSEPLSRIKPRTLLLLRRAQKAGVIHVRVDLPPERRQAALEAHFLPPVEHAHADLLREAGALALDDLVLPSVGGEAILDRRRHAERSLLPGIAAAVRERCMTPPYGAKPVVAVIPGATGACRLLVVDPLGRPGETEPVHPLPPRSDTVAAAERLHALIAACGAEVVAVAGSRRARTVRDWVRDTIAAGPLSHVQCVPVHEAAALALAESETRRDGKSEVLGDKAAELPASVRAALSLGRYVQDPLREISRWDLSRMPIDPSQRDLDQGELRRTLDEAVQECVARVGVDVNTAEDHVLARLPGLDAATAREIVAHRAAHGPFASRADVRTLEGLGEDAWQRAGGFLRVRGGNDPLDATGVHPTGAPLAVAVAESLKAAVTDLIGRPQRLAAVDPAQFVSEVHTESDVRSVLDELARGSEDPRGPFVPPAFNAGLHSLKQLKEGMELTGVVRTISQFGAFVDLGLRQEGLVHVSELAHRFVRDPAEVVNVGDTVRVKVIGIDPAKRRISLSVKQLLPVPEFVDDRPQHGDSGAGPAGGQRGGFQSEVVPGPGRAGERRERSLRDRGGPRRGGGGGREGGRGRPGGGRGGRGDDRGRGGDDRRSRAPAPRAMPKEGDPFHMQLNALREQLGMQTPPPARPKDEPKRAQPKQKARPKPDEATPVTPSAEASPSAAPEVAGAAVAETSAPVEQAPDSSAATAAATADVAPAVDESAEAAPDATDGAPEDTNG